MSRESQAAPNAVPIVPNAEGMPLHRGLPRRSSDTSGKERDQDREAHRRERHSGEEGGGGASAVGGIGQGGAGE